MRPESLRSEWFEAKSVGQIRYVFVPAELLSVLLSVVQAINATYRDEAATPASKRRSQGGMGADQLLPVRRTITPAVGAAALESSGMCTGPHDHFCLRSGLPAFPRSFWHVLGCTITSACGLATGCYLYRNS